MGNMSNLDMDRRIIHEHYNSDEGLRDCVNDLILVIASMQENIGNLYKKVEQIEDKLEELL